MQFHVAVIEIQRTDAKVLMADYAAACQLLRERRELRERKAQAKGSKARVLAGSFKSEN
jgi:hypothetical protein